MLQRPPAETGDWVQILQADPGLAAAIPESTRNDAAVYTFAHTYWVEPGEWNPVRENGDEAAGSLGLLILNGFLVRHVRVIDRPPAELLGPGDLLHPWEPDHTEPFVAGSRWDVIEPARLAVLDRRFATIIGRWPDLVAALFGRAIARSRSLLLNLAIGQLVGVDIRLLVLLWHIAERWGDHDGEGAHDGVRRPGAPDPPARGEPDLRPAPNRDQRAGNLTERGLISRRPEGLIVLHGEPPTEFRHLRSA